MYKIALSIESSCWGGNSSGEEGKGKGRGKKGKGREEGRRVREGEMEKGNQVVDNLIHPWGNMNSHKTFSKKEFRI